MVWISRICYRKYGNFVDNLRLYVRGGSGGMGLPRLGGQGGKGGDVWVVAQKEITLKRVKDKYPQKRFIAGVGTNSSVRALRGQKGEDQEVFAPPPLLSSVAQLVEHGACNAKVVGELNTEGDRVLVARGGQGGSYHSEFLPSKGQTRQIRLDLKLIADLGLVGFPNAGKSSLLTALSHAKPQIASYAFTTLRPEIGKVMYEDHKQISVADLPGLIEGAHMNRGMGHQFLKHVERTRQLIFVVDVCGFQLASKTPFRSAFEAVQLLTKELELYKEDLPCKPAVLVVNKMDLPDAEDKLTELQEQLLNPHEFSHLLPEDMVPKNNMVFRHLVPISAATGFGIAHLKTFIRQSLDEDASMATESLHRDRLQALRGAVPAKNSLTWGPTPSV
ncbi:GTP-binding protein 10 [Coregonus clupeaformis]|uniref:GTP-binding protein 10 n=1 Tax=Coregonus clupeaformis TaxID=59861 RepID=UPI001BE0EE88|nr:GTP-binding protein 10 [Coregonus clupeaformis]